MLGLAWLLVGPAGERAASTHALWDAIDVDPGATCLDKARLLEHVARWLGRKEIDARIRVEVSGHETRTDVASFRVTRGEGRVAERTLDPAPLPCADLHAGLAFAIFIKDMRSPPE